MSNFYTNIQWRLKGPSQRLPSCSPYITFDKNAGKNNCTEYPPIPRDPSEIEPQVTWFSMWQISCLSQLLEHHNKIYEELEKPSNILMIST